MPDDGFALSGLHKDIFMTVNLKNRNFLKLLDYTPTEIQYLIDLAIELKTAKKCRCQFFRANQEGLETVYGTVG